MKRQRIRLLRDSATSLGRLLRGMTVALPIKEASTLCSVGYAEECLFHGEPIHEDDRTAPKKATKGE